MKLEETAQPALAPPSPRPGCLICEASMKLWRMARDPYNPGFDLSHATDLAVEVRRHPHPQKRRAA